MSELGAMAMSFTWVAAKIPIKGVVVNYDEHKSSALYKHIIFYGEILTLGEDDGLDRHFQQWFADGFTGWQG